MPNFLEEMGESCFPVKGVSEQDAGADLSTVIVLCAVLPSCALSSSKLLTIPLAWGILERAYLV